MIKLYKTLLGLAVAMTAALPSYGEAFEYLETFDIASDFSDGATLPEGWASTSDDNIVLQRQTATYIGIPAAYSGSYVLGNYMTNELKNQTFYTKMFDLKGGAECKLSFMYYTPGGTRPSAKIGVYVRAGKSQDYDDQTYDVGTVTPASYSDWTKFEFTFTPEEDGDYCFSFRLYETSDANLLGACGFDDIQVTGYDTNYDPISELEPDEENLAACIELPYSESFDNENLNYTSGDSYLPDGWATTGSQPFITASYSDFAAHTGSYYMLTQNNSEIRADRAFTPFMNLTAGKDYEISFYICIPGNKAYDEDYNLVTNYPKFTLTVGTEQEIDFHPVTLLTIEGGTPQKWVKYGAIFTPQKDGPYCFGFNVTSEEAIGTGGVVIDDLLITADGLVMFPRANFGINNIYDLYNSYMVVFPNDPVTFINNSEYSDSYKWTVSLNHDSENDEGETVTELEQLYTTDEETLSFAFPETGTYTIALTATNSRGTRQSVSEYNIEVMDSNQAYYPFSVYGPSDAMYGRGSVPTYSTDSDNDFITGMNHYYYDFAERIELPEDQHFTWRSLSYWFAHYNLLEDSAVNIFGEKQKSFNLVFYGETDGKLDETKEFGRYSSTMYDTFGSTGIGDNYGHAGDIILPDIETNGVVYVAWQFDPTLTIDVPDANMSRTHFAISAVRHASGVSTLFVKPYNVPREATCQADGNWYPIEAISETNKGFGTSIVLWGDLDTSSVAITSEGKVAHAARYINGNFEISGTEAGETVALYTISGQRIAVAKANGASATISAGELPAGVYIVTTARGAIKVIK
jgi:hypothetical protein